MNKTMKVVLVAGGVVLAGYVFRRRLADGVDVLLTKAEDLVEQLEQKRAQKNPTWKDDGSVDDFLSHPETGEVRSRPATL